MNKKLLTSKRLKELGFKPEYKYEFWNGSVFVDISHSDVPVYVSARITSSEDYARPALGVETEQDLMDLCRLVNGPSASARNDG